jgi:hypothetical protein
VSTTAYDAAGNLISRTTDPRGNVPGAKAKVIGRQTEVTDPNGHTTPGTGTTDPLPGMPGVPDADTSMMAGCGRGSL